jgi:hypothetical protein
MPTALSLLRSIGPEVEGELKPNLKGLKGAIVRGYLPQTWVFKTDKETVALRVDREGNVSAKAGGAREPDVVIRIDHKLLTLAIESRERPEGDIEPPEVEYSTRKGRTAFKFLRGRLGL